MRRFHLFELEDQPWFPAVVRDLATEPHPAKLATFFPGLLFGWLRAWRGGIGAAIAFPLSGCAADPAVARHERALWQPAEALLPPGSVIRASMREQATGRCIARV